MDLRAQIKVEVSETTRIGMDGIRRPDAEARHQMQLEPDATPVMYQTWKDLLFVHWEWPVEEIQASLPPGLYVDTFGAKAYLGLIPFRMLDVRASFLPAIPGAADFLELNVRTYVHDRNGRPGVWFYSLDLNHGLGVLLAKVFYSLPYHNADIRADEQAGMIRFECHRQGALEPSVLHYRQEMKPVSAPAGSLAHFLVERYLLYSYSSRARQLYCAQVHHAPWQLFEAVLGKHDDTMLRLNQFNARLRPPDHAWYASPVRVKIYALEKA